MTSLERSKSLLNTTINDFNLMRILCKWTLSSWEKIFRSYLATLSKVLLPMDVIWLWLKYSLLIILIPLKLVESRLVILFSDKLRTAENIKGFWGFGSILCDALECTSFVINSTNIGNMTNSSGNRRVLKKCCNTISAFEGNLMKAGI